MAKKKVVNERCPLQAACERKCEYVGSECNCDFFSVKYQPNGGMKNDN